MHMMSRKDLSLDEFDWILCKYPVLAASGEVHTNEEAQVHVNDLIYS